MGEQLSALDTMFLELEQADDGAHMHIGAALVFDPLPQGGTPDIGGLRRQVRERLPLLPRFAERLSSPRTSPLAWLTWVSVGDVDVDAHVHHARLPEPGGQAELLEFLGDFWSHRLDRTRPLWEMTLVDGLADGRWAMATKTHHCLVDGVGSLDIGDVVLDTQAAPAARRPPAPRAPVTDGGRPWLSPGLFVRGARAGLGTLRHPLESMQRAAAMGELLWRDEVLAAPGTSLNVRLGGTRHFTVARFELDDLRAIRTALGGTVNDVVLALCAGALRRLLMERGEPLPARGLRAQVPVNLRPADREHALGNELTSLFVDLPVAEPDPVVRYESIVARAGAVKRGSQGTGAKGLVDVSEMLPPAVGATLGRMLFGGTRMFNLTITNVPGPAERRYALGAPLVEVLPLVPLFSGHAVGIAAVSYAGSLVFGIHADRAAVPDVAILAEALQDAYTELRPSVRRPTVRHPLVHPTSRRS